MSLRKEKGRKGEGICHKEEFYTDTHTNKHTPKHNISNPNRSIITLTLNQIIPITYHNIPHTNSYVASELNSNQKAQSSQQHIQNNKRTLRITVQIPLRPCCQYTLNQTLNEINGKQSVSTFFCFTMKLILELTVIFP